MYEMEWKLDEKLGFSYQVTKSDPENPPEIGLAIAVLQTRSSSSLWSHRVAIQQPIQLTSAPKYHRIVQSHNLNCDLNNNVA